MQPRTYRTWIFYVLDEYTLEAFPRYLFTRVNNGNSCTVSTSTIQSMCSVILMKRSTWGALSFLNSRLYFEVGPLKAWCFLLHLVYLQIYQGDFSYACRLIIKIVLQWHLQFRFKSHILICPIKIFCLWSSFVPISLTENFEIYHKVVLEISRRIAACIYLLLIARNSFVEI